MRPLDGYVVIDASNYVTGPFAAMMLGDLGADVIKVEPPGGDPNRRIGRRHNGVGMLFVNLNRGKRGIVLDLKTEAGLTAFTGLVRRADVLVENWRPGVTERLGLADAVLADLNRRLVHVAITGYGADGPRAGRGVFDSLAQAVSGLAWFHSRAGRPELLRTYVADKATSAFAAQAALAALLERERTGVGRRVDVNMLDAVAYFDFPDVLDARTVVADADPIDPEDNPGARTMLRTSDGWIVVAPSTGAQVERACKAAGHPEWVVELRGLGDFRRLAPALMSRLQTATVTGTTEQWLDLFDADDVPVAPVLDIDAHLAYPQVTHNRTYRELDDRRIGRHRYARYPDAAVPGSAAERGFPDLDEHGPELRRLLEEDSP